MESMDSQLRGLKNKYHLFNILAYLCSMIPLDQEYTIADRWLVCPQRKREELLKEYDGFFQIMLEARLQEYTIASGDEAEVLSSLERLGQEQDCGLQYLAAIKLEGLLGDFEDYYLNTPFLSGGRHMVSKMMPLNDNYDILGLKLYPKARCAWDTGKSSFGRSRSFNGNFCNYCLIRPQDEGRFRIVYYLWKDAWLSEKIADTHRLRIAVSPVTNDALLDCVTISDAQGERIRIDGIKNEDMVISKVTNAFEKMLTADYDLILFPEVIGSPLLVSRIQELMCRQPDKRALVLLPTYYEGKQNKAILLGPGGSLLFQQNKLTAFVLRDSDSLQKEDIDPCEELGVLFIRGIGGAVIPICADLVDPGYAQMIYEKLPIRLILCPSYSVGAGAFENALLKGMDTEALGLWFNTCAAGLLPCKNYGFDYLGALQLPNLPSTRRNLRFLYRECGGKCRESCYFEIVLKIDGRRVRFESLRHVA